MNNGPEAGPLFVTVTLNLRTASPAEADRSLRGHWREARLLGVPGSEPLLWNQTERVWPMGRANPIDA